MLYKTIFEEVYENDMKLGESFIKIRYQDRSDVQRDFNNWEVNHAFIKDNEVTILEQPLDILRVSEGL